MSAGPEPRTAPRIAIIGSTSPIGKALRELLEEDGGDWNLTILDTDEYAGLLQEFRNEIEIVRVISPERLEQVDAAVFTCAPDFLNEYLDSQAYLPGFTIDVTGGERNGRVFVDGISDVPPAGARDPVIAPRADTIVLSRILGRLHAAVGVEACEATILESAAENGSKTMDRLQEETVEVLSFKRAEDQFDQLAFNLIGPDDRARRRAARVARQIGSVSGDGCRAPAIQFTSVPMFEGTALSVHIRLRADLSQEDLVDMLAEGSLVVISEPSQTPLEALGKASIHLSSIGPGADPNAFWLWIVTDNLRLAADNVVQLIRKVTAARE